MKTRRLSSSVILALATTISGIFVVSAQPPEQNKEWQKADEAQLVQEEAAARDKAARDLEEKEKSFLGDWRYSEATRSGVGVASDRKGSVMNMNLTSVTGDNISKVWSYYLDRLPLLDKRLVSLSSKVLPWNSDISMNHTSGYPDGNGYVNVRLPAPPRSFATIFIQNNEWTLLITISKMTPKPDGTSMTEIYLLKRQERPRMSIVAPAQQ